MQAMQTEFNLAPGEGLFCEPSSVVRMERIVKGLPVVSQEEADQVLKSAVEYAKGLPKWDNSDKTILSLFDESGVWSAPYVHAGYNVIQVDIQNGVDVLDLGIDYFADCGIDDVYGVLAACPCTHFANSGARWFADKDAAGVTQEGIDLVNRTLDIVDYFQPEFWAIENPMGRIKTLCGLPSARLYFQPHHFGDPYTKRTQLFGFFNANLRPCNVLPTEGSRVHRLRGDVPEQKKARSLTPEGFAYAFFEQNQ